MIAYLKHVVIHDSEKVNPTLIPERVAHLSELPVMGDRDLGIDGVKLQEL
jgi:hypothetical protein